ncbi:DNA cytosine methyltransferase [Phytoactinopolyspora limicola]|uniref:DNA cytosine methyltransferase n=1 Tax=Phytoactinopolyspora limicola TaxID=2715536 RepID=UPI0014073560|nr:DNA cytosine methyltransferase [Phytoactinopolyspora limicola]
MSEFVTNTAGLYIPANAIPDPKPVAIDLFAGAGGFSLGFHQAGWHVAAAVENDLHATASYLLNLGGPDTMIHTGPGIHLGHGKKTTEWTHQRARDTFPSAGTGWIFTQPDQHPVEHFWHCNIQDVTGAEILTWLGMNRGDVGCIMGGPPCQGFSKANPNRSPRDTRNTLVFQFARLVLEVSPKTMVMENVPDMLNMVTAEGVPVVDALARVLADGGFSTFDALRRSITAMGDAGGAVRKATKPRPSTSEQDPHEQAALFDTALGSVA